MCNNVLNNSLESSNHECCLWFPVQVQGVELCVGCKLMCTFNNVQVSFIHSRKKKRKKKHSGKLFVNKAVYWLSPS